MLPDRGLSNLHRVPLKFVNGPPAPPGEAWGATHTCAPNKTANSQHLVVPIAAPTVGLELFAKFRVTVQVGIGRAHPLGAP